MQVVTARAHIMPIIETTILVNRIIFMVLPSLSGGIVAIGSISDVNAPSIDYDSYNVSDDRNYYDDYNEYAGYGVYDDYDERAD